MACPNCSHTMHNLGVEAERKFWCPRCGAVKSVAPDGFESVEMPRWTAPRDGVPDTMMLLHLLHKLVNQPLAYLECAEYIRGRDGEAREAFEYYTREMRR